MSKLMWSIQLNGTLRSNVGGFSIGRSRWSSVSCDSYSLRTGTIVANYPNIMRCMMAAEQIHANRKERARRSGHLARRGAKTKKPRVVPEKAASQFPTISMRPGDKPYWTENYHGFASLRANGYEAGFYEFDDDSQQWRTRVVGTKRTMHWNSEREAKRAVEWYVSQRLRTIARAVVALAGE